ncbi:TonB-dependent receptor domain-containing protein [Sphingomonas sp. M1-B02]|uniref:TonB-dependent receptor domain-containing protein n=1 Tax=Sphingomonas sp. M1-B02 TaxID=3114300 RepID=UPI00223EF603|nr:TonB-dependent receptor [Sphingomonas sp. S6-11]UZK65957.1 TonB-dependent receptor [Sphingomonas sp. S6-11]
MAGFTSFKNILVSGTAIAALACAMPAFAQTSTDQTTPEANTPTGAGVPVSNADQSSDADGSQDILVTGSRIRQDPNNSALPLQVITTQEIQRNGISSPEQLIMFLSTNGSGADNLASNSDVTTGAQRGTNGLSAANLRGQGSAATLVLLNGRRVAAHGLSGGAVDVNQIPFAAIERVEVLKDGASAIYGTDAVGGVINFITRKDYQGLGATAFTDVTEAGGGSIYRLSGIAGYGDLDEQGFNIMGSVSYSWNKVLNGSQRDFVNGDQPNRGLSIDTRGTPIATAFNIGANTQPGSITANGTLLSGLTLTAPNGANAAGGGINPLDLPGGAGCASVDGGMAYDEALWNTPAAVYSCSWDTGRAAVLQQPIDTLTYYVRGVANLGGNHQISLELTGSDATSAKRFSNAQLTANTTNLPIAYPLNAMTAETYNGVFNSIRSAFSGNAAQVAALNARYGQPISYRWRCIACGPREYVTDTKTFRAALGIEGPLWEGWDYRAGASYAKSESSSVLGTGYYYRGTLANGAIDPAAPAVPGTAQRGLVGVMNSGLINPFSLTQTAAGLAALEGVSAYGATLYGGQYEVKQFDGSISGPLFPLWGRDVQVAVGVDYRRETYAFNGSDAAAATAPVIFLAAFDNVNALTPKNRDVKAAYAEVLIPLLPGLEVTGAVRIDDYTGFGSTTNPKVSVKYRPIDQIMFRGSYNSGFRVPSFNQIFNGLTESPYSGSDLANPVTCPGGVPTSAFGSGQPCAQIRPNIFTGGNPELGPETSKQLSAGVVFQPAPLFSASIDWWMINVDNTIQTLTLRQLIDNAALFRERFIPDATGGIGAIDQRWINAGSRRTQGLEVSVRGGVEGLGGQFSAGLDGTLLLKKREKLTPTSAYGPSLIGVFTFAGDLGVKWKHNAFINYSTDDVSIALSQLFRKGYKNGALPGIANGTITRPDYNAFVKDYIIYNLSLSYTGLAPGYKLTAGIRNLFDTDPPFAVTYDGNTGAGGSWEARVADPRGRSFTIAAEVKF